MHLICNILIPKIVLAIIYAILTIVKPLTKIGALIATIPLEHCDYATGTSQLCLGHSCSEAIRHWGIPTIIQLC